ncbi:unnamed protein product [Meloidogyne enterolobii]|uniref:Uncharacterized protein n=1 Tax=Meloidogyne enterolobii TaxID=390850 RepID=A0ACB0YHX4_MELEN
MGLLQFPMCSGLMQKTHLFSSINFCRRSFAVLVCLHSSPQCPFFPQNIQGYIGALLPPSGLFWFWLLLFLLYFARVLKFLFFASVFANVLVTSFSLFLLTFWKFLWLFMVFCSTFSFDFA